MSNTEFETQVLSELKEMKGDIKGLHQKFDSLDDRLDEVEGNLKQEMRVQGAYLNQAFDRMSFLQQNKADFSAK